MLTIKLTKVLQFYNQCYNKCFIDLLIKENILPYTFLQLKGPTKMCEFIFRLGFIVRLSICYKLKSSTAALKKSLYLYFRYGFSLVQLARHQIPMYSFFKLNPHLYSTNMTQLFAQHITVNRKDINILHTKLIKNIKVFCNLNMCKAILFCD